MSPHHPREVVKVESGDLTRRHERDADTPERDRRGVGNQAETRSVAGVEAQSDEHARRNSHWRTEAGAAFEKGAEPERDQHRLQAPIVSERADGVFQDLESARLDAHLVQQHRGKYDPADRKQSIHRALQGREGGQRRWHAVDPDGDHERGAESQHAGSHSGRATDDQHVEQEHDRRSGHRGRRPRTPERAEHLSPQGARLSSVACGLTFVFHSPTLNVLFPTFPSPLEATAGGFMDERALFLKYLEKEGPATRKVLSRVPDARSDYRPEPKSRTAREIAWLLVHEERFLADGLERGAFEWVEEPPPATMAEVLAIYDAHHDEVVRRLKALPPEQWTRRMPFIFQGQEVMNETGYDHGWITLFDQVHHRGQLSTYLRPMGSTVPQIYGPSADEPL